MTSLARMEEGKPPGAGRCLLATDDLPLRQPRRISNLVPRVAVISQSEGGDVGPAVTPPRGCRATLMHPGLVALPGSGAVLETPVAASLDAANSPAGAPGGHVVECVGSDVTAIFIARENLSLAKRCEPGSVALHKVSESYPCAASHVHNMRESHAESVAPAYVNRRG